LQFSKQTGFKTQSQITVQIHPDFQKDFGDHRHTFRLTELNANKKGGKSRRNSGGASARFREEGDDIDDDADHDDSDE
jgi:hypothetical protein